MGYLIDDMTKTAAREDFSPKDSSDWTRKVPRTYKQWEKLRPQTDAERRDWEDWQNSADHGDGDAYDKERFKAQRQFAQTGESESEWIARYKKEDQAKQDMRHAQWQKKKKNIRVGLGVAATGATLAGLAYAKGKGQEKKAALKDKPIVKMFRKDRYKPRGWDDNIERSDNQSLGLMYNSTIKHKDMNFAMDDQEKEVYDNAMKLGALSRYKKNDQKLMKYVAAGTGALALAGGLKARKGYKTGDKADAVLTGMASASVGAIPVGLGLARLKERYDAQKPENIAQDKRNREIDDMSRKYYEDRRFKANARWKKELENKEAMKKSQKKGKVD